jgi:3'-phosphoadenosine 5'-phosphosulfate sulfotransferase (PAPS reductase)/FAD synthetase
MQDLGMDFEAVFVDHGGDWPETYEYFKYFVETGRPVTVLKPQCFRKNTGICWDNLYDYAITQEIFPSVLNRWCTKDFKVLPVNRYIEKPCFMHLGIDAGESRRAKINSTKGIESRWLLIENNIDRQGCIDLIKSHLLMVPPKSGCWFCPFQKKYEWRRLRRLHPELYCKGVKLEEKAVSAYKYRGGTKKLTLRGDGVALGDLINENQAALPGMEDLEYPPCQCHS